MSQPTDEQLRSWYKNFISSTAGTVHSDDSGQRIHHIPPAVEPDLDLIRKAYQELSGQAFQELEQSTSFGKPDQNPPGDPRAPLWDRWFHKLGGTHR